MSDLSQAIAKASTPFMKGVSQVLNHEFTPEQRIAMCDELEGFIGSAIVIVKIAGVEPSEVLESNTPVLIESIGEIIGRSITDEEKEKLAKHVKAVTLLTLLVGVSMQNKPTQEKE